MPTTELPQDPELLVQRLREDMEAHRTTDLLAGIQEFGKRSIPADSLAQTAWKVLKPQVVRYLYGALPFDQFLRILQELHLRRFEFLQMLDPIAGDVALEHLLTLSSWNEPPHPGIAPHLTRRLMESPEESVTHWCRQYIDERAEKERESGTSLRSYIQYGTAADGAWWGQENRPDDKGLSKAVHILTGRHDPAARELLRRYLLTLPWGEDRQATEILLTSLQARPSEEAGALLFEALEHYSEPSPLRLRLLDACLGFAPDEILAGAVRDLDKAPSREIRELYLDWLWQRITEATTPGPNHLSFFGISGRGYPRVESALLAVPAARVLRRVAAGKAPRAGAAAARRLA